MGSQAILGAFAVVVGGTLGLALLVVGANFSLKAFAYAMLGRRMAKNCGGLEKAVAAVRAGEALAKAAATEQLPTAAELRVAAALGRVSRIIDERDEGPPSNLNGTKPH